MGTGLRIITLCVYPVGIQVGESGLVAQLLNGLKRLMVDLENATRSPPAATLVCHCVLICQGVLTRCQGCGGCVVRDGAWEDD